MSWFERYQREMRRTRWVSITGAVLVLVGVARELFVSLYVVALAENVGTPAIVEGLVLPLILGAAFVARILALRSLQQPYRYLAASWFVCASVATFYIWWSSLPTSWCNEDGLCFNVYDIARTNWVRLCAVLFVLISIVRSTITILYVGFTREYR